MPNVGTRQHKVSRPAGSVLFGTAGRLAYLSPGVGLLVAIGYPRERILVRLLVELLLFLLLRDLLLGLPRLGALRVKAALRVSRHRQGDDDRCDRKSSHFSVSRQLETLRADTITGTAAAESCRHPLH